MGLITGLLTLPLAPVRGVAWIAEQVAIEADRQLYDPVRIRRELLDLELEYEEGRIDEAERDAREEELFERLAASQARTDGWDYFTALRHGVFCELGKGSVPFASIADRLHTQNYQGWITVEQDVLPGMGSPKASAQRNRSYLRAIGL